MPLQTRVSRAILGIASFALIGTFIALALFTFRYVFVRPTQLRLQQAQQTVASAHEGMLNQETGVRGFLATRDELFLQPYYEGVREVTANDNTLATLTDGDVDLNRDLLNVRLAQRSWIDLWAGPALSSSSTSGTFIAQGKTLFDTYRGTVSQFNLDIMHDLTAIDATSDRLALTGIASECLVLCAIVGFWYRSGKTLRRSIVTPVENILAQVGRISAGDFDTTIQIHGPREIVAIGAGIEAMRNSLFTLRNLRIEREAELAKTSHQLQQIVEMARSVAGSLNLHYVLDAVGKAAVDVGACESAVVWLLEAEGSNLIPAYDTSRQRGRVVGIDPSPLGQGIVGKAARFGRMIGPDPASESDNDFGLAIPMIVGARVVGVIELRGDQPMLQSLSLQVDLLDSLANQAATAVEAARLYRESEQQAQVDALTELGNRRRLDTTLARELDRSLRHGRPMAFVMLDVDHFKQYNDRHGHQDGDEALQELARLLLDEVRSTDEVFRYGGEEFSLLLPDTDTTTANVLCERIRLSVDRRFKMRASKGAITISMGIACLPEHATTTKGLVRMADSALYDAKASGRNCVRIAVPNDEANSPSDLPEMPSELQGS